MAREIKKNWAYHELEGSVLGDERFRANIVEICTRLEQQPESSFSAACGSSLRKSSYRLFEHKDIDLLRGHFMSSLGWASDYQEILISEDTTDVLYKGLKACKGLGNLGGGGKGNAGLCVHSMLALSPVGLPLGLLGQHVWAPVNESSKKTGSYYRKLPIEQKENYCWLQLLELLAERLKGFHGRILVISDREADFYEYFVHPRSAQVDLLVRARFLNRWVHWQGKDIKLQSLLDKLVVAGHKTIDYTDAKTHKVSQVKLSVSYTRLIMPVPVGKKGPAVTLSVVRAYQQVPVQGKEPIEWVLLSTKPVDTLQQAFDLLDNYTKRWLVERFHYVLKQGMEIEKMQFREAGRLVQGIALYSIAAYRIMWLCYSARQQADQPCGQCFNEQEVDVLEKLSAKKAISVTQALLIIASLVGFTPTKKYPLPGLKMCWQGWKAFQRIVQGVNLCKRAYETG